MFAASTKFTQCHIILCGSYSRWLIFWRQWPNSIKGPTQHILWERFWEHFLSLETMWLYWNLYLARWDTCFAQKTRQHSSQFLLLQDICVHSRHMMPIGWDDSKCCRSQHCCVKPKYLCSVAHLGLAVKSWQLVICSYAVSGLQLALQSWTKLSLVGLWNTHWDMRDS